MQTKKKSPVQAVLNYMKSNPIVVLLVLAAAIVGFTRENFFS